MNSYHFDYRSPSPDNRVSPSQCRLHAYDFFRQRWRFLGRLPEVFSHVSCISTQTTLYLFGGQLRSGELSDRIWMLSLATLKWQMSPVHLPCARGQHTCVLFHDVVLLFFGITNATTTTTCRSVDMFDLTNETWVCLDESLPPYQCEPIVATRHWLLLSNRNDTQMLHTYKLRMRHHQEETVNGQIMKRNASNDDVTMSVSSTSRSKAPLSKVSPIILRRMAMVM